ncbi:MAG: FMN-binding negative transcriptional regulator [Hyphomicrobiaceae bacterium]
MYQPAHFREERLDVQHELIRRHPLAMLVSCGAQGLVADPIPFVLDPASGLLGTLRCHMARANPHWKLLQDASECLVLFQGAEHYITPSWYASKRETGKVVPTWNYATVHVWGAPRVIQDAAWLRAQVEALTGMHEEPRAEPWAVSDAPEAYVATQIRGIVGIEIPIARIEGKWKVSQNRDDADRAGVRDGLASAGPQSQAMCRLVGERMTKSKPS